MHNLLAQDSPLIPPTPIDEVIPLPLLLWWEWALLGLVVLILLGLIYLILKVTKRKVAKTLQPSALAKAERKLDGLAQQEMNQKELVLSLSLILREYITHRFDCPTLFQTNEEINTHHLDVLEISVERKQEATTFINQLEKLKYSISPEQTLIPQEIVNSLRMLLIQLDREWQEAQQHNVKDV